MEVSKGQIILWSPVKIKAINSEVIKTATVGFVLQVNSPNVGRKTCDIILFPPGYHNGLPKSAVREYDDPDLSDRFVRDTGCWFFRPEDVEQHLLMQKMKQILEQKAK
ncbi:MAG: hypothetical protein HC888_00530 [Candidatus Competibacteraceae bacterium]|nr:hypothetical protein [Candidatus Competibacteraceae bacterium]